MESCSSLFSQIHDEPTDIHNHMKQKQRQVRSTDLPLIPSSRYDIVGIKIIQRRNMLYFIRNILGIKDDPNIVIYDFKRIGNRWYIYVEYRIIYPMHCPQCDSIMHIKDVYERTIRNDVFLTDMSIILKYRQRSWQCPYCHYRYTPQVSFVRKWKQHTNISMTAGVMKMSDLTRSVSSLADDFNISDTSLHNWFMQYVDIRRRELPVVLSIDEVYTNFKADCKYALCLMDFETKELIDIVQSRREKYTTDYFMKISLEERKRVRFIISDMYQPYIDYADRYFPNARIAVDSFHVISWLCSKYSIYLNQLANRYRKQLEADPDDRKAADNYYLLKNHKWILLKNEGHIVYDYNGTYDRHFRYSMTTHAYRDKFYAINTRLSRLNEAKEMYIRFNDRDDYMDDDEIRTALEELITYYLRSDDSILMEFGGLLKSHEEYIINSFVILPEIGVTTRLSNGPMESFNRKPKDLRRLARGCSNFEFYRMRIMFSERNGIDLLGEPRQLKEIKTRSLDKRGPYKKNKDK